MSHRTIRNFLYKQTNEVSFFYEYSPWKKGINEHMCFFSLLREMMIRKITKRHFTSVTLSEGKESYLNAEYLTSDEDKYR